MRCNGSVLSFQTRPPQPGRNSSDPTPLRDGRPRSRQRGLPEAGQPVPRHGSNLLNGARADGQLSCHEKGRLQMTWERAAKPDGVTIPYFSRDGEEGTPVAWGKLPV